MDEQLTQQLKHALSQKFARDLIVFLYREHEEGASFAGLKEMLFLHQDVEECQLEGLVNQRILEYDGWRYRLTPSARSLLDEMPDLLTKNLH